MSIALVKSRALLGLQSPLVDVEIHIGNGLPAFNIVGLPEAEVRESRERVRAAILQSGFEFPNRRLTVNLAPADLPKNSGRFDLPIAIGILVASGQVASEFVLECLNGLELVGELSLTGAIRPVAGLLAMAVASQAQSERQLVVPKDNALDLCELPEPRAVAAASLAEVVEHLLGASSLEKLRHQRGNFFQHRWTDFGHIKGQEVAKRAFEIAAAGSHGLIMLGAPGTGKSLLASAMPSILPPLDEAQATQVMVLHDLQPAPSRKPWGERPYRAPHHSASAAALVGGGSPPKPGEVSLAHNGVLFLDEFPEFQRHALESLREPLETGTISISRAARQICYPASFQLIAAMNPCPCGYYGNERCRCTREQVLRYQGKISGPLLDRIDLQIQVFSIDEDKLFDHQDRPEASTEISKRVDTAYMRQKRRQGKPNAQLLAPEIDQYCQLPADAQTLLNRAANKMQWSSRASHRVTKLARTIADLEGSEQINTSHIAEAVSYRRALLNTKIDS